MESANAKQYKFWLPETPIDRPIVMALCREHYDSLSFVSEIEAQEIIAENVACDNPAHFLGSY